VLEITASLWRDFERGLHCLPRSRAIAESAPTGKTSDNSASVIELVQEQVDAQANDINVFILDLTSGGYAKRRSVDEVGPFEDV